MIKAIIYIFCKLYPPIDGKPIICFRLYHWYAYYGDSRGQKFLIKIINWIGPPTVEIGTANLKPKPTYQGIEKQLDRAGYVEHSNFWQKGFVRTKKLGDVWKVWHDIGTIPQISRREFTTVSENDLFDTLRYFERI